MSAPPSAFDPARLKVLPREFFNRDPRRVCRELLGRVLVRREGNKLLAGRIVELEAYMGTNDPAAHAYIGATARNRVLFGPPGHAYIYFIYGNHYCLNVSCMPEGKAGSVLFRALEPLVGIAEMERARGLEGAEASKSVLRLLTSGPGRLAEAFGITRLRDNDKDLTDAHSDLFLADAGYPPARVLTTVRVGITKAAERPLRYVIAGNEFVSGKRVVNRTRR
ncbi:MAG TPA: DNA-3-methyladenine glycosylase [Terriglobales bacterium]|nr:DNA-3-methyladenine glycosylase [Terriglobales bacterium]